jgi:hypothetical protein
MAISVTMLDTAMAATQPNVLNHTGYRNGGHTAKCLELYIGDFIILYIDVKRHHITANRIADFSNPVSVFNLTDISGVRKMIHYFFSVHP